MYFSPSISNISKYQQLKGNNDVRCMLYVLAKIIKRVLNIFIENS